jgi:hypothetical protein
MRKIMYYAWIGIWIIIGTPLVFILLFFAGIQKQWHNLFCKKCKIK